MFAALSELRLLIRKAKIFKLAAIAEENSRGGIWRTYFTGKKAELFYCKYAVLEGFADTLKIPTKVLNMLKHPAWLSVQP